MVFELVVSGLCALILSPCPDKGAPTSFHAVFPTGARGESPMEHYSWLVAEPLDVDPRKGTMPDQIFEVPGGRQVAAWKITGRVEIYIGEDETQRLTLRQAGVWQENKSEVPGVMHLGGAVKDHPKLETVKSEFLGNHPSTALVRTRLDIPVRVDGNADVKALSVEHCQQFDFRTGAPVTSLAERASVRVDGPADTYVFKLLDMPGANHKPKRIVLRRSAAPETLHALLFNLPKMPPDTTRPMELGHFPLFYALSSEYTTLQPADRKPPTCTSTMPGAGHATGESGVTAAAETMGVKPVVCIICQGCG